MDLKPFASSVILSAEFSKLDGPKVALASMRLVDLQRRFDRRPSEKVLLAGRIADERGIGTARAWRKISRRTAYRSRRRWRDYQDRVRKPMMEAVDSICKLAQRASGGLPDGTSLLKPIQEVLNQLTPGEKLLVDLVSPTDHEQFELDKDGRVRTVKVSARDRLRKHWPERKLGPIPGPQRRKKLQAGAEILRRLRRNGELLPDAREHLAQEYGNRIMGRWGREAAELVASIYQGSNVMGLAEFIRAYAKVKNPQAHGLRYGQRRTLQKGSTRGSRPKMLRFSDMAILPEAAEEFVGPELDE
jgi:hypothetical protein